jgi:Ca2+-binding RTX toxin-like protein
MLRLSVLVVAILAVGAPVAYGGTAFSSPPALLVGDDTGSETNQITVLIPPGIPTYRVAEITLPMTPSTGCSATPDPTEVDCNPFQIQSLAAFLHGGNDSFQDNAGLPAIISGGDGNDTLGGGSANDQIEGDLGNDFMYGSDGNDVLQDEGGFGSGGTDQLYGQGGNDHLDGGVIANSGAGADVLDGGTGTDSLTYAQRTQPLTITEDGNSNDGQAVEADNVTAIENFVLGSAGDHVTGDGSANTLDARAGGDFLNGGAGNDHLLGGSGNDTLTGSTGADVLSGGPGIDKASYTTRTKRVTVTIGLGANDGVTGEKDNVLDDVEVVLGGLAGDVLTGEDGANTLVGGAGADQLNGLGGDDNLNGGTGADVLAGGSGDEIITGGPKPDKISGGSGDDVINAKDSSKDTIDCGTGNDHVTVDAIDVVSSNCEHVAG